MGRESSFGPARRVYYHRWEHGQLVHQNAKRSAHEPCHRGHRARDVLRRHQTNDANHGEAAVVKLRQALRRLLLLSEATDEAKWIPEEREAPPLLSHLARSTAATLFPVPSLALAALWRVCSRHTHQSLTIEMKPEVSILPGMPARETTAKVRVSRLLGVRLLEVLTYRPSCSAAWRPRSRTRSCRSR